MFAEEDLNIKTIEKKMQQTLVWLEEKLSSIRTDRVGTDILNNLRFEIYNNSTKLSSLATVIVKGKRLLINVWDKNNVAVISKTIQQSDLGFNPRVDGTNITINVPDLTEERRKELLKSTNHYAEEAKIALRNTRREFIEQVKKATSFSKDDKHKLEKDIDVIIKKMNDEITQQLNHKHKTLLKV